MDLIDKFPFTAARIDQMGVGIAPTRQDAASSRIHHLHGFTNISRTLIHRSESRDAAILHQEIGMADDAHLPHLPALQAQESLRLDAGQDADTVYPCPHSL